MPTPRLKRAFILGICSLVVLIMSACSSPQKVTRPDAQAEQVRDFEKMNEDFNPVDLADDDLGLENQSETAQNENDIIEMPVTTVDDTIGTGYRVQIIQTTDPEEAKDVERDAILRFDYDVYRVFGSPYYKVRIGDFVNWSDAEKLQRLAIRKGFRDAWVIRTTINLKKANKVFERF